jgi:hypothetical protein
MSYCEKRRLSLSLLPTTVETEPAENIQLYRGNLNLLAESLEIVQRVSSIILGASAPRSHRMDRRCSNEHRSCPLRSPADSPYAHHGIPRLLPQSLSRLARLRPSKSFRHSPLAGHGGFAPKKISRGALTVPLHP